MRSEIILLSVMLLEHPLLLPFTLTEPFISSLFVGYSSWGGGGSGSRGEKMSECTPTLHDDARTPLFYAPFQTVLFVIEQKLNMVYIINWRLYFFGLNTGLNIVTVLCCNYLNEL